MNPEREKDADALRGSTLFTKTHWTTVLDPAANGSETALNVLFSQYRRPLLIWLRAHGYSSQEAEEFVQDYFVTLLRRDFLKNVGRGKGKFRSFLLVSLKNHLNDRYDKNTADRRGGDQIPDSLQQIDEHGQAIHDPAGPACSPDLEYDREWARALLANAFGRLEAECARTGHGALCTALQPVMFADETASSYREIGERLQMSEGSVKVAAHRIRARLRRIIRDEVLQTVASEEDLEEEVRFLMSLFGR